MITKYVSSSIIFLRFEVGGVSRKMNLVSGNHKPEILHRSFCAVLVRARKNGISQRNIVCARVNLSRELQNTIEELLRSVIISQSEYFRPTTMLHVVQHMRLVAFANS